MIKGIDHVGIVVQNIDKASTFCYFFPSRPPFMAEHKLLLNVHLIRLVTASKVADRGVLGLPANLLILSPNPVGFPFFEHKS